MKERVLVVAAHPDDETLGCGGTLLRYLHEGAQVHWLIVTAIDRDPGYTRQQIRRRRDEIRAVAKAYGFAGATELGYPSKGLEQEPLSEIIDRIRQVIKAVNPTVVLLPHAGDIHTDHRVTHRAVVAAARSFRAPGIRKLLAYETVSETEFAVDPRDAFFPNAFVDISDYLEQKIRIMKLYKGEIRAFPFPRSERNLKALATYRGAVRGSRYAEAFMVLREMIG